MNVISSYLSWSDRPRIGSSSVRILDKIQSSLDEDVILESAGHTLARLGCVAENFDVRRVFIGGDEAMEVYDPNSKVGVVIIGVTLMDDEFAGKGREAYC